ncbi:hypothetical protein Q1695_004153 [Nippostrongylus brasiliensis]|nr:hypothetical protein Q1695_004153 [Nippostrongylus brasiliensis]
MNNPDLFNEPLENNDSLADKIGQVLREAQSATDVSEKLKCLQKAEHLLLKKDISGHLLDNFLDEMLEFTSSDDFHLRCFSANFIEKACKKDADVLKKAITNLSYLLVSDNRLRGNVKVMKRVIIVCTNIYPYILKWASSRKADSDVEKCWEAFSVLKGRIVSHAESDNEGIRTMTFKFLEAIVLSQSLKTEESDTSRGEDVMSLSDVPRDHRFISYRKLQSEATVNLQSLMDQTTIPHISAQNLLTVLTVLCTISRRRPEYMARILDCLEALHINLPPTLGASQVKSMRKELKAHLLRILKHPSSLPLHLRITTLLTDLGASQSEINRAMPANIAELRRKASKRQTAADEPAVKKKARPEESSGVVLDDDEYGDDEPSTSDSGAAIPDSAHQSAIDITAEFIYERLNPKLVANLVLISLVTLPDEMPAAFASSFTQIATAGTEQHRRHLARSMATQATAQELGPGAEQMRKEKLAKFMERQSARKDGAFIPPTPAVHVGGHHAQKPPLVPVGALPGPTPVAAPTVAPKVKQQFNLFTDTKELSREEMESLFESCFLSIMKAERRARQGGTMSMHHVVLVRIATRFYPLPEKLYNELIEFIVDANQHRHRTDLALLWITELYSQYQGFTVCFNHDYMTTFGRAPKSELFQKFDTTLCSLLQKLLDKGQHKEALFHKLLLDCPLVTTNALSILEKACLDEVYGAFGITTLRELLLTRNRQRSELVDLLFKLSFFDRAEVKQLCVDTLKELCSLKYMHKDLRLKLIEQLNECTLPTPPPHFVAYRQVSEFDEMLYRNGIHLYLAILPLDTSLLLPLAKAYTKASTLLKKIMLRSIENSIKAIGMDNEDMLQLLDECPVGAESFVARVVHLLTERQTATKEVVNRMKKLHEDRKTDVRSLIPILNGLEKEDIVRILPLYVLKAAFQNSVGLVFKRLLTSRSVDTGEPTLTAADLLYEYHKVQSSTPEEFEVQTANLRELMESRAMTREAVADGIERLMELNPLPALFYCTLVIVYKKFPSLDSFLGNIVQKVIAKDLSTRDEITRKAFYRALNSLKTVAYSAILTKFSMEEFEEFLGHCNRAETLSALKDFLPTLSNHQQKNISSSIIEMIKDKDEKKDKSRDDKDKEKDKERERIRLDRRDREREKKERRERDSR